MECEGAAVLAELHARAFANPWSASAIIQELDAPTAFCMAVGAPWAGFILARASAGEAEVLTLAVDPAARRRGLGRALVEAVATEACARGAEALWLEVAEDNMAARALYAAAGFEPTGRRRGYYARPGGAADALILKRPLNTAPA